jgi:hypothetical protein
MLRLDAQVLLHHGGVVEALRALCIGRRATFVLHEISVICFELYYDGIIAAVDWLGTHRDAMLPVWLGENPGLGVPADKPFPRWHRSHWPRRTAESPAAFCQI